MGTLTRKGLIALQFLCSVGCKILIKILIVWELGQRNDILPL